MWLHVDAAYAGSAAIVPEMRHILDGCERADSLVLNPHKWLFTPFDLSVLYCRHLDLLRRAFRWCPNTCARRSRRKCAADRITACSLAAAFAR